MLKHRPSQQLFWQAGPSAGNAQSRWRGRPQRCGERCAGWCGSCSRLKHAASGGGRGCAPVPARGRGGSCPGPQCARARTRRQTPARWPAATRAPCSPPRSPRQPCPRCASPRLRLQPRAGDQPSKHFQLHTDLGQQKTSTSTSVQEEGRALTVICRRRGGVERNRANACRAAPGAPRQPHCCHSAHLHTQSFVTLLVRRSCYGCCTEQRPRLLTPGGLGTSPGKDPSPQAIFAAQRPARQRSLVRARLHIPGCSYRRGAGRRVARGRSVQTLRSTGRRGRAATASSPHSRLPRTQPQGARSRLLTSAGAPARCWAALRVDGSSNQTATARTDAHAGASRGNRASAHLVHWLKTSLCLQSSSRKAA